jgi:hypothetical protein
VWLSVAIAVLATLSSGAYAVVTSISVIGLYASYIIPVYLAWRARGTPAELPRGPWHLGRYGWSINLISVIWVLFITVILSTPENMRAGKAMAGLTLLLSGWYLMRERHRFRGPAWASAQLDATAARHRAGGRAVVGGERE